MVVSNTQAFKPDDVRVCERLLHVLDGQRQPMGREVCELENSPVTPAASFQSRSACTTRQPATGSTTHTLPTTK